MAALAVRPARRGEGDLLSALCVRSKAHWGYDPDFMARCAESLRVRESAIAAGHVLVAGTAAGEVLGVAAVVPEGPVADLDLLFVEPARLGQGAGAALFAAAARRAARLGATRLTILADPHAAYFYARQGAVFLRNAPSDAIPGRLLPLYEYALVQEAPR